MSDQVRGVATERQSNSNPCKERGLQYCIPFLEQAAQEHTMSLSLMKKKPKNGYDEQSRPTSG